MNKYIVLVDLDGTLCDLKHRLHHVQGKKKDFDTFYSGVSGDAVNWWCRDLIVSLMKTGYDVRLVSARRESCREDTIKWINNEAKLSHIESEHILKLSLVRPDKNTEPDTKLKSEWLDRMGFEDKVAFIIDDRKKVVDMWRARGITVLHCSDWDESSK